MNDVNQAPAQISTSETFLFECSRSNSIQDQRTATSNTGEENAIWSNKAGNFQVRKGDNVSIEMAAMNIPQTSNPMEFSGYDVILEGGKVKPYVDNRVVLEIGYYIINNQAYCCNLPLETQEPINAVAGLTRIGINPTPSVNPLSVDKGVYPGIGMGFGHKFETFAPITEQREFQTMINGNAPSFANSYRIFSCTGDDYTTPLPDPVPAGTRIYSIVLEMPAVPGIGLVPIAAWPVATPTTLTSYATWLYWNDDPLYGEGGFMSVGQEVNIFTDALESYPSNAVVCDIRASQLIEVAPPPPPYQNPQVWRVQILFAKGAEGGFTLPHPFRYGTGMCFSTPNIRFNDLFRSQGLSSWNNSAPNPNTAFSQLRQDSGLSDFFSNGIQGSITTVANGTIPALSVLNPSYQHTVAGLNFIKGGGIGSANRQQGTDNRPYILTRNDFMGCRPKANLEKIGRYNTWCPDLHPLTSFIVLEASDLLMDANALASKINDTLHASLGTVGNDPETTAVYETNIYGYTRRYKKSSQLLPFNQTAGYFPYTPYIQNDGDGNENGFYQLTFRNTQLWNSIDTYFTGGCKQIIPCNIQPGFNKFAFIGFNSTLTINMDDYRQIHVAGSNDGLGRQINGGSYPSFETSYLRTCKRPPDYYGDACSWNNVIVGNRGCKDLYKEMWGDIFNKIPVWSGNTAGMHEAATARNFSRPVVLNSQLQNIIMGGDLLKLTPVYFEYYETITFPTTVLIKNQMIFTNIYYDEAALILSETREYPPLAVPQPPITGDITNILDKLVSRQRDLEVYINTGSDAPPTYKQQRLDAMGYGIEFDLGMTNDSAMTKWGEGSDVNNITCVFNWDNQPPVIAGALPWPSYNGFDRICPSSTSPWFGSGVTYNQTSVFPANPTKRFDWNKNSAVLRPIGRLMIQSRYDSNWLNTSNTGGQLPYPAGTYPQIAVSEALDDTVCQFKDATGNAFHSDEWSRKNDMGIYPYEYTDESGKKHIFMAFRVAQDYKPATTQVVNSEVTNTWRIGQFSWGSPFGFSASQYDNNGIVPMNPDDKLITTRTTSQKTGGGPSAPVYHPQPLNQSLIENCNGYIAVGANNPTFLYSDTKSRMELTQTYQSTQLSPYNTNNNLGSTKPVDTPNLGEKVAIFNDICPDAYYSPNADYSKISGGGNEACQNQRSEETGIFIYKVWLPSEDWAVPTDINLFSYWSNDSPDGQRFSSPLQPPSPPASGELWDFPPNYEINDTIGLNQVYKDTYQYRDNQDGTANNRDIILTGMIEATGELYTGCLLDKLGFTLDQFIPVSGKQWNRYTIDGYNNPQPDLQRIRNTKPLILGNQSNITLNDAFNINYYFTPTPPPADPPISGLPNYGLGMSNGLPVVTNSTDSQLTANNPIESTNSPFYQIYSNICQNHYLDNGIQKNIMFYVMKNYVSSNYSYGYGSTFSYTATTSYNLDTITTEIRNPISGRLMRVLQPNSVITYKIVRPITLAPDTYDAVTGLPLDPSTPLLRGSTDLTEAQLFNIVEPTGPIAPITNAVPASEQIPTYFFNSYNQVVNAGTPEAIEYQTQESKRAFNEGTDGLETKSAGGMQVVSPLQDAVVEAGAIQADLSASVSGAGGGIDATDNETKDGGQGGAGQSPGAGGGRGDLDGVDLLNNYLVHLMLNEIIPPSNAQFQNSTRFGLALTNGLAALQAHSSDLINSLAAKIKDGETSSEDALIELGKFVFNGNDEKMNQAFRINRNGQRLSDGEEDTESRDGAFKYDIDPASALRVAQMLDGFTIDDGGDMFAALQQELTNLIQGGAITLDEIRGGRHTSYRYDDGVIIASNDPVSGSSGGAGGGGGDINSVFASISSGGTGEGAAGGGGEKEQAAHPVEYPEGKGGDGGGSVSERTLDRHAEARQVGERTGEHTTPGGAPEAGEQHK